MKEYFVKYSVQNSNNEHTINYSIITAKSREDAIAKLAIKLNGTAYDILICDTEENLWTRNRAKMWELKAMQH